MRRRGREDGVFLVMMTGLLVGVAASAAAPMQSGPWGFVICYGIAAFFTGLVKSTSLVSIQLLTPSRMRATVVAMFLIVASLFGFGIGPALTAGISAYIFNGEQDLAPALTAMSLIIGVPVIVLFIWARSGLIARMRNLED
jgi:MFS family permease